MTCRLDHIKRCARFAFRRAVGWMLLATLTLVASAAMAIDDDDIELLPEDQAFAFSAELKPDRLLEVTWKIAEGYYMYRDRISYAVAGENTLVTPAVLPAGKPKHDPLFGDVEIFENALVLQLQLADDTAPFTLIASGQGCNEPVGVCYPPIQHEIAFVPDAGGASSSAIAATNGSGLFEPAESFSAGFDSAETDSSMLPAANNIPGPEGVAEPGSSGLVNQQADNLADQGDSLATTATASKLTAETNSDANAVDTLRDLLSGGFDQPDYLAVEDAFQLAINQSGANALDARFTIADGYYLYRQKITFTGAGSARIVGVELPTGVVKEDEYLGKSMVFKQAFTAPVTLDRTADNGGPFTVQATYQGCAEGGICYPPVTSSFTLELPALIAEAAAGDSEPGTVAVTGLDTGGAATFSTADGSILGLLFGALAAGLLLTFTPCVLPMIPILSSVIAGQGENLTRWRGGGLAICYVIGTVVTYAAMGAMAGATGEQLQAYFQNVWAIGILAAVFFVMALSMFGLFELQMPAAIQTRLQTTTSDLRGSVPLVFILGLFSALIVGACVSPVLISFLGIAISRADPGLGALMMAVMAIGMGLPLIVLGFGAGHLIPKAGSWMQTVRYGFGVLLIAVSIYLLGILPDVPVLLLWGVFFIIVGTYLGAARAAGELPGGWQRLGKGIGTVLLVWGIASLIGGFTGGRDVFRPLPERIFQVPGNSLTAANETHLFTPVKTPGELNAQLTLASAAGKRVMIDFYADWCVDCIKMEQSTFQDPQVVRILADNYLSLQVDVTDPNDPGPRAIKKQLGVFGPPAVLFFERDGTPLAERNFYGYRNPRDFLGLIDG